MKVMPAKIKHKYAGKKRGRVVVDVRLNNANLIIFAIEYLVEPELRSSALKSIRLVLNPYLGIRNHRIFSSFTDIKISRMSLLIILKSPTFF